MIQIRVEKRETHWYLEIIILSIFDVNIVNDRTLLIGSGREFLNINIAVGYIVTSIKFNIFSWRKILFV